MKITWFGHSCVKIESSNGKTIIIDPYKEEIGFKLPNLSSDIVLISHNHYDHNNYEAIKGNPFIAEESGEYNIGGFSIIGVHSWHDEVNGQKRGENIIWVISDNEFSIAHFGDFGQKELTPEQADIIGDVDILFIPIGGIYTINGNDAVKIINKLEPKVVSPIHYKIPGLKTSEIDGAEEFLRALGVENVNPIDEWKVKASDLPLEGIKVVIFNPKIK